MGIIAALIATSVISAISAAVGAGLNYASTAKTSQSNIDMQNQTNKQNQYNIEHAHQIEMQDLKAAGLNPVLTATGGQGAPVSMLQSPKAQAPQLDLSGIGSAMSGLQHAMTMQMMMEMRGELSAERNATLSSIAKGHDAQSAANAALRASMAAQKGDSLINSSKSWMEKTYDLSPSTLKKLKKIAGYNLWK